MDSPWFQEEPRRQHLDEASIGITKRAAQSAKRAKEKQNQPQISVPTAASNSAAAAMAAAALAAQRLRTGGLNFSGAGFSPMPASINPFHVNQNASLSHFSSFGPLVPATPQATAAQALALAQAKVKAMISSTREN